MNNKKLGTDFEHEVCGILAHEGWWVHFIAPDARGAQPFDVIAVMAGKALAIDCKTCAADKFSISRLEDNQVLAFEKWLTCGNEMPEVWVKHNDRIYRIPYKVLKVKKNVLLEKKYLL